MEEKWGELWVRLISWGWMVWSLRQIYLKQAFSDSLLLLNKHTKLSPPPAPPWTNPPLTTCTHTAAICRQIKQVCSSRKRKTGACRLWKCKYFRDGVKKEAQWLLKLKLLSLEIYLKKKNIIFSKNSSDDDRLFFLNTALKQTWKAKSPIRRQATDLVALKIAGNLMMNLEDRL